MIKTLRRKLACWLIGNDILVCANMQLETSADGRVFMFARAGENFAAIIVNNNFKVNGGLTVVPIGRRWLYEHKLGPDMFVDTGV